MYESFLRPADDPWFSPDRVDWHRGSRHDGVGRIKLAAIEAVRGGKRAIEAIGPLLIKWISDARVLREAWDVLTAKGATAPGPNGQRYADFDDCEVWSLLKSIGEAIRNDTYRVGDEKEVKIPKDRSDPSRGTRPISLIDIEDRVVQRAAVEILQLLLDPLFGRNVLGYRPQHGRLHALALAEQTVFQEDRYVLVVEDIKDAFTRVPLNRLLDILAIYIPSKEVLQLIDRLLDSGKRHGIRQGGPLSPLLLNLYLHHVLDVPWQKDWPTVLLIRVADDMLLVCKSQKEASQARAALEALLGPANMRLKGTPEGTISDLRKGASVRWLGFVIGKDEQELKVEIADKAWARLEEYLALAHETPDSSLRAADTIGGWIDQQGPCHPFVNRPRVYEKLAALAEKQAFDEIPTRNAIRLRWRRAYERWCELRTAVLERPEVLDSGWAPSHLYPAFKAHNSKADKFTPPWE